jgi:hypothetical protein
LCGVCILVKAPISQLAARQRTLAGLSVFFAISQALLSQRIPMCARKP